MSRHRLTDSEFFAQYFYFSLIDIIKNEENSLDEKFLHLFNVFKEVLRDLAGREKQFFSNDFARLVFLLDKYSVSFATSSNIKQYQYLMKQQMGQSGNSLTLTNFHECVCLVAGFISELSGIKLPDDIVNLNANLVPSLFLKPEKFKVQDRIKFLQAIVKNIDNDEKIITINFTDSDEILRFKPLGIWENIINQSHIGSTLNLIDVLRTDSFITTHSSSIVVLEPDFLFDATEIAEAFDFNGFNPCALFIKRIAEKSVSMPMILGNIVNTIFDYLIINPFLDFEDIYYSALKERPLSLFQVAKSNPQSKKIIKENAKSQYETLKEFLATLNLESFAIEPTFISPLFGLQGRLDLLAEYHSQPNRKNIYELKSGTPAKLNHFFKKGGTVINTGVYVNHFAQVTVYNMLLDTCYPNRKGNSAIIYSKDSDNPLRNVPNYKKMKQEIILARNQYLAFEHGLLNASEELFVDEWDKYFANSPYWIYDEYNNIKTIFNNANPLVREYFSQQLNFVLTELYVMKLGNTLNSGFAALWKETIAEKKIKSAIITGLYLVEDESDFDNLHLSFAYSHDKDRSSSFRKGDMCVLYPEDANSEFSPGRGRLIKCNIKDLSNDRVIVSVRNKLEHSYFASGASNWILDFDNTDSLQKSILHSLTAFLKIDEEKQKMLLGLTEPQFDKREYDLPEYLSPEQKKILQNILNAEDYFLLQGPPGTGKTKYMLAGLVETLIKQTDENILILAYTNRAVDEICSALKSLDGLFENSFDIIRLGKKDSTIHKDIILSQIIESNDINLVYKELLHTRVFVATIATVLTYPELLEFKQFQTAVIDEASQITESNLIAILTKVNRFVLIGDEKQLPAIVLQARSNQSTESSELNKICLDSYDSSLFERLLRCAKLNNWENAYAMLRHQARMHSSVMNFPARFFYNNQLKIFDTGLQNEPVRDIFPDNAFLSKEMTKHRFIFINTDVESHSKYNINEADAVVKIIQTVMKSRKEREDENILGVISPFRLQCALIQKKLSVPIRGFVNVDTVEKFQGSQRDFIIISMAVNNPYLLQNAQSLKTIDGQTVDRKLNVALTRAKSHLVILGNEEILSYSSVYMRLIEHCKSNDAFFDLKDLLAAYNN